MVIHQLGTSYAAVLDSEGGGKWLLRVPDIRQHNAVVTIGVGGPPEDVFHAEIVRNGLERAWGSIEADTRGRLTSLYEEALSALQEASNG